jgi:single-strand DNA-binding protein
MASLNKVQLIGNLGADPEIRAMTNGRNVASLSLATSESWKDKTTGERKEKTEWHRVIVMNDNLVKVIENYTRKGSKLYVEGSLQTRKWTDKEGQDRYTTEIVLGAFNGQIVLLDGRGAGEDGGASNQRAYQATSQDPQAPLDDDIPF